MSSRPIEAARATVAASTVDGPLYHPGRGRVGVGQGSPTQAKLTIRFRPLSPVEVDHKEEGRERERESGMQMVIEVYSGDGKPQTAFAYDHVFPSETTSDVYNVAAKPTVVGALEGINGNRVSVVLIIK